jgi:hypothetical protein
MIPRWPCLALLALLTACGDATGPALAPLPERPADARFVTTDITNFWRAYDAGASMEGIADFVGELASGTNVNEWLRPYALPRESALWDEFKLEMGGTNVGRWLYSQGNATADRPGDLGYFIGYQIARAYYDHASNKRDALRQIIEVRDGVAFLAASGYDGGR